MKKEIPLINRLVGLLFLLSISIHSYSQTPTLIIEPNRVSTFAGSTNGLVNGIGAIAKFNLPTGIAADTFGNYFVADFTNNLIRKISPSGVVSIFAGSGVASFADGIGTSAAFYSPTSLACDLAGNIYVADQFNNRIRKITQSGVVTTFAGNGFIGAIDGSASTARFNFPCGISCDLFGNVYVADQYNHIIRKISSSGVVSTLAGSGVAGFINGTGTSASFNLPTNVTSDSFGNLFVADFNNHVIRKITPSGVTSTYAGTGVSGYTNGTSASAKFNNPTGVFVDQFNDVYVADKGNNVIRRISFTTGLVSTYAGSGTWGNVNAQGVLAQFANPYSIVKDKLGNLFVADAQNHQVKVMSPPVIDSFYTTVNQVNLDYKSITIGARNLVSTALVTAPFGFQISLNPISGYTNSFSLTPINGELHQDVYFRLRSDLPAGGYNGNINISSSGAASLNVSLVGKINCFSPILVFPNALKTAYVGYFYFDTLSQSGLDFPTWKVSSGVLPSGLTIDTISGIISGIPSAVGLSTFTITAKAGICTQSKVYDINVIGIPLSRFVYTPNTCANRNVQFKDSSILATSWLWDFGDGTTATIPNPVHTFPKDSNYKVSLTINGTSINSYQNVSIATTPIIPALSVIPSCNFIYTFMGAPSGFGYTYNWNFALGSSGSQTNIQRPTRGYLNSGTTDVNLVVSAQGKCNASAIPFSFTADSATIGVTARVNVTSPGGNQCSNSRIITNTSLGSGTLFKYSLDGGPFVTFTTTANLNGLSDGDHQIRLAATDLTCFDTAYSTFTISNAIASFTSTQSICNHSLAFTNTSSVSFGSPTYQWVFGSPTKGTSTSINPSFNFGVPGVDTVWLTVNALNGCSNTIKQAVVVGTASGPTADFTFSLKPGFCTNAIQFNNTTINGSGASYLWNFGDGTQATQFNFTKGYADTGNFTVSLTVTTPTCSLIVSKIVHVSDSAFGPSAKFTINNPVQLVNSQNFNFVNLSTFLNTSKGFNTKYYWSFGDATVDSLNNSVYGKKFLTAGVYTVTLAAVSNVGCIDLFSQSVRVDQIVVSNFGYIPNSCSNRFVQFRDSSALATNYLWNFGDGDTSTAINPSHLYLRDSIYTVSLTINGNIMSSRDIVVATTPIISPLTYTADCGSVHTFFGAPSGNGYNYNWSFAAGSFGSNTFNQIPTRSYTLPGLTNVSVIVNSYGKCAVGSSNLAFVPKLLSQANIASYTISASGGDLCSNARILTNNSNAGLTCTYSIDNNTFTSILGSVNLNNLAAGPHYLKFATTNGTCFDTAYQLFYISNATANFTYVSSNCNQVVSFTNVSSSSDNWGLSYLWNFGTPLKGTSVDENPSFNFMLPGIDSVTLKITSSSGCSVSIKKTVNTSAGSTALKPGFSYSVIPGNCANKFQFIDSTKGGTNISYSWDFGDGTSSSLQNPVKSFGDTGYFNVTLTTTIGLCFATVSQLIYISPAVYGPYSYFKVSSQVQNLIGNSFNFVNQSKNLNAGWIQSYYWKLGDGVIDSLNNSIYAKTYNYADTFEVTLVALSSTGCVDSTTRQVIVLPQPLAKFGVVLNNCSNRTVSFIDSSTLASSYIWSFGDGDSAYVASPNHVYATDGTYIVTQTINGIITATKTIVVASNPSAQYTFTKNNCSNQFKFVSIDKGSNYQYSWSFNNGIVNDTNLANPTVDFTTKSTCLVNLLVSSYGKCPVRAAEDTIFSEVGVKASASLTTTNYCGNSRIITNTSSGSSTSSSLSLDGGPFSSYTTPVTYSNLTAGNHQLLFATSNGTCSDTFSQQFAINSISGDFQTTVNNCNSSVEFFSGMVSSNGSKLSYLWTFEGGDTSTIENPIYEFVTSGKRKVTLSAMSTSGCIFTFSDSVLVGKTAGPTSTFTATEIIATPCQTGFNFLSTSVDGTLFYWNFGDGYTSSKSNIKSVFHSFLDTGIYNVTMVASNNLGCSTVSDTLALRVTVAGKPSPSAFFTPTDTVRCLSFQDFTFINGSTLGGNGWINKFSWNLGDGIIDTVSNSIYGKRYNSLGTYLVQLTATSNLGCSKTYSRIVRVVSDTNCNPLGMDVVSLDQSNFDVYPNPNNGELTIRLDSKSKKYQVQVIDLLGRIVVEKQSINTGMSENQFHFNLASGKYYLELTTFEGDLIRKPFVVIER